MSEYYGKIMKRVIPGMMFIGSAIGAAAALVMLFLFPNPINFYFIGGWVLVGGAIGAHKLKGTIRLERESGLVEDSNT